MAKTPEDLVTAAVPTPPYLTSKRRTQALLICIAAAFLTLLDVSIVTVALPSMEEHLHLTPADVTWSLAGYTLTFGLMLVPAGRLGDEFGRRKIFVIGMVLFIITGVLCGIAPDATFLDASRLARGLAAGLIAPQVVGMLHQMYPARERGRAFGYYGATVSLSTAIGPLFGGIILHIFGTGEGWRWVFLAFIPLDVVVLFLALRLLPEGRRVEARRPLDLVGVLLLGLAVTAVMLPLLQSGDWVDRRWWLTWSGLALLVVFVLYERAVARQGRQPLVDLNLFRERHYWVGTLVAASLYGGFTGIFLVLTQFLQQGLGYTALHAALSIVAFTVGSAVCGVISGRIVHRVGPPLVIVGTAVTALGLAGTALVVDTSSGAPMALLLAGPLLVAGCGAGLVIAANQTLALHRVPRKEGSTAAGIYQTGMKIGTSLGTALATSLYFSEIASTHGDFAAAARVGLIGGAALAAVAFLVALPGLTLGGRRSTPAALGQEEAEMVAR
ncbi:MFS transporter [Streptomyces sp. NPDC093544]|uniref:MFS transporter n=1 Tax=Streptomyces sp. NPDC093544 TaxID=3155200 RepID=UPI003437F8AB